ncbi:MAG: hypothetical protein AAB930_03020 [Patescibacteria group bacterium]
MLSESQLKFLTDVLITIGEVSLASLIIPYFTSFGFEPTTFIWGIIATASVWISGLIISKNIK